MEGALPLCTLKKNNNSSFKHDLIVGGAHISIIPLQQLGAWLRGGGGGGGGGGGMPPYHDDDQFK